jgi:hypothetical protein
MAYPKYNVDIYIYMYIYIHMLYYIHLEHVYRTL